jgi:membrane-associated phospholipid phosphatase
MQDLKPLQRWSLALAITTAVVILSYHIVDRPLAQFIHAHTVLYAPASMVLGAVEIIIPIVMASAFASGLWVASGRTLPRWAEAFMLAGYAQGIALVTVEGLLKPMFGRTWPNAFLHDGTYGFHFFHGGRDFASFPSGHTCFVSAALLVFWVLYPRGRAVYVLGIAAVIASLLLVNGHFLGDTAGGLFVGATAAWLTVTLWRRPT